MNKFFYFSIILVMFLSVAGCASKQNLPLVFGQSHTVGLSMSSNVSQQGGEITLGYKDWDFAIVPVTIGQGDDGTNTQIKAVATEQHQDALSVLGQFNVETKGGVQSEVGLGKFFATGMAAKTLADGFKAKLSK
ncbi:MAG: hypothetical protein ACYSR0_07145 [Planctomycetota bacterium]|jgi:hypothetical protein